MLYLLRKKECIATIVHHSFKDFINLNYTGSTRKIVYSAILAIPDFLIKLSALLLKPTSLQESDAIKFSNTAYLIDILRNS